MRNGPLVIGGVGGSGTRVVAEIVHRLGVFIGDNLNHANDNMDFPGKRHPEINREQPTLAAAEIETFAQHLIDGLDDDPQCTWGWGWKNPPNHLFLAQLAGHFPELRYVHVIRNGLDMALSKNHNQVKNWGHLFDVRYGRPSKKRSALAYWIKANDSAIDTATQLFGERFMLLNFDDLCTDPMPVIESLAHHLGVSRSHDDIVELAGLVQAPASLGRGSRWPSRLRYTAADVDNVARFGFDRTT